MKLLLDARPLVMKAVLLFHVVASFGIPSLDENQEFFEANVGNRRSLPAARDVHRHANGHRSSIENPGLRFEEKDTFVDEPSKKRIDLVYCPSSVSRNYSLVGLNILSDNEWCHNVAARDGVEVGKSWGRLRGPDKAKWEQINCNDIIATGGVLSCDDRWGWGLVDAWRLNNAQQDRKPSTKRGGGTKVAHFISGLSEVECSENYKGSSFCKYSNVVMDFTKISTKDASRSFKRGFLATYGKLIDPAFGHVIGGYPLQIPHNFRRQQGWSHTNYESSSTVGAVRMEELVKVSKCDIIEDRPIFVLANDDVYNLAHYMNDVGNVWIAHLLANKSSIDSVLLNIDGFRGDAGPGGGDPTRLMNPQEPDDHGPFESYYKSWFQELKKAADYAEKREKVCFSEVYFPIAPGVPWYWNSFGSIDPCIQRGPSPLYQSFNLFLRQKWSQQHVKNGSKNMTTMSSSSLGGSPSNLMPVLRPIGPPTDRTHVVIEVRRFTQGSATKSKQSSSRVIANLRELVAALKAIPGVSVTAQNFARIPFAQQVALAHSASIFVAMHGAGSTHIFHSALGRPNCWAYLELAPDRSVSFGNLRTLSGMLGMHYEYIQAPEGSTRDKLGTIVSVDEVKKAVKRLARAVRDQPSCLGSIKLRSLLDNK